jgi:aminopeptidase-like protein
MLGRDHRRLMLSGQSIRRVAAFFLLFQATTGLAQEMKFKMTAREVVESRLGKYGGDDRRREAELRQMFADAGCDSEHLSEQPVKGELPNVVCVLPGRSDRTIIVGAHFDHISEGDGVVDNWSGASLLPSLYEALKIAPREHSYVFIGFSAEEKFEVGSRFYVKHMTQQQVSSTAAMVNMDTLGLSPTKVWASHADKGLVNALFYLADQLKMPVSVINVDAVGSSDSEQFAARKIPSITIHSLTQQTFNAHILHTSKDKISEMRLDDYYESYHLIMAYLAFLDQNLDAAAVPAAK